MIYAHILTYTYYGTISYYIFITKDNGGARYLKADLTESNYFEFKKDHLINSKRNTIRIIKKKYPKCVKVGEYRYKI